MKARSGRPEVLVPGIKREESEVRGESQRGPQLDDVVRLLRARFDSEPRSNLQTGSFPDAIHHSDLATRLWLNPDAVMLHLSTLNLSRPDPADGSSAIASRLKLALKRTQSSRVQ